MNQRAIYRLLFAFIILFSSIKGKTQQVISSQDSTTRQIQIVRANSFRHLVIDSLNTLTMLAGNAIVRQGNTTLSGDSIVLNEHTGIAEVFGNVHINDADSVHTYARYLKYLGFEKKAILKKQVKLTDGNGVLHTESMEYNLITGIANYSGGGKVINGKTVLTSRDAVYYSDTKDVFFKNDVILTDPNYGIKSDSLQYNTLLQTATFIAPTRINTKDGNINTRSGTYNLQTGEAIFLDKTAYSDSTRSITGNKIAYDEKSGVLQIEENGKFVDSVNKVIVIGNQLIIDKKKNTFLGTRRPVMIFYSETDSTYITADTLFSGMRIRDTVEQQHKLKRVDKKQVLGDSSLAVHSNNLQPDSIRYFIAFHHVRIFNDSLQAVADSLHYSTEDSTFKLFQNPVCWNNSTQINGDTMYLYTENKQPKRFSVFNSGMVINKTKEGLFNQISGRTLNGFFVNGNIDFIRVKGSQAESVFYPQDDDSAYIGLNRSSADVIEIRFHEKKLNRVSYINKVKGALYPLNQIPDNQNRLKSFNWMEKRRPKNKLELFE